MLLITEDLYDTVSHDTILDESTGKKSYYIKGVFLQSEQQNRNGRIYPASILEREVEKYTKAHINTKQALGEVEHPSTPSINLERVSHLIESLTRSGNDWIGKAKVLSSPMGNLVKGLLEDGVRIGVSSRGLGTLSENAEGVKMVNEDYQLTTVDIVSTPSAHDAWVNGIMEGVEFYMGNDGQFIDKMKKHIDKETAKKGFSMVDEALALQCFNKFLNNIRG